MHVWSTDGLPDSAHFAFWREVICDAFAALDPQASATRGAFPSSVALDTFGDVNLARIRSCAQSVRRGARQIRIDPQDRLFVNLQLAGVGRVVQGDRRTRVPVGSFTIVDTAQPYRLEFDEAFEVLSLRIPRARLLPFATAADAIFARPVDGLGGMGRIAVGFMRLLADPGHDLDPEQRADAAGHLCDLIAATLRGAAPRPVDGRELARRRFVASAIEVLQAQLPDPQLGVETLARRFGVSTRYVQLAFRDTGSSVSTQIRMLRLARCAHDLANRHDRSPIKAIAARWGFAAVPHFTTVFGQQFGCTPSAYRRRSRS